MTLGTLFTQIADAIRSKTGSTAAIPALSMPDAIAAIPTGDGGSFDPASFGKYYVNRFLAVYDDTVSFYVSTNVFPTFPKLIVVPCVQDRELKIGGSFVMIRDEEVGYRIFFNGIELEVYDYQNHSGDGYLSVDISFEYDRQLQTMTMDEMEQAMFWF